MSSNASFFNLREKLDETQRRLDQALERMDSMDERFFLLVEACKVLRAKGIVNMEIEDWRAMIDALDAFDADR